ncbi:MAG: 50S ribosomal protein L18a [Candidatus Thorarchaeota archaeon]|nr:50S ribosomal protein L18a [Candidatus Thorarchaeota archaeon]
MSPKVWRAKGKYNKKGRTFRFEKEMIAPKPSHVEEKILSELGSRHRVKRRNIDISKIEEVKPEEVTDLEIRRILGVESEFE